MNSPAGPEEQLKSLLAGGQMDQSFLQSQSIMEERSPKERLLAELQLSF
jgi:hypothetical protein